MLKQTSTPNIKVKGHFSQKLYSEHTHIGRTALPGLLKWSAKATRIVLMTSIHLISDCAVSAGWNDESAKARRVRLWWCRGHWPSTRDEILATADVTTDNHPRLRLIRKSSSRKTDLSAISNLSQISSIYTGCGKIKHVKMW